MTDPEEDRRAIAALVHRLRSEHGDVKPLGEDAEPFAAEFIAALRAFGWRPVCVVPASADWRKQPGNDPDAYERGGQLARELLANRNPVVPVQGTAPQTETQTSNEETGR
jgi:hypothetical protein